MNSTQDILNATNHSLVAFIKTELNTALVFASIAAGAGLDSYKRLRSVSNARVAYEGALHFLRFVQMTPAEAQQVVAKVEEVKAVLAQFESDSSG